MYITGDQLQKLATLYLATCDKNHQELELSKYITKQIPISLKRLLDESYNKMASTVLQDRAEPHRR